MEAAAKCALGLGKHMQNFRNRLLQFCGMKLRLTVASQDFISFSSVGRFSFRSPTHSFLHPTHKHVEELLLLGPLLFLNRTVVCTAHFLVTIHSISHQI